MGSQHKEIHSFYSLQSIRLTKSRIIRQTGQTQRMVYKRKEQTFLFGKPDGKGYVGDLRQTERYVKNDLKV
jgi:hypothetical protein